MNVKENLMNDTSKEILFGFGFTILVGLVFVLLIYWGSRPLGDSRYIETNQTIKQDVKNLTDHERQIVIVEKQLADVSILLIRTGNLAMFDDKVKRAVKDFRKDPLNPYTIISLQDQIHRMYILYSLK